LLNGRNSLLGYLLTC